MAGKKIIVKNLQVNGPVVLHKSHINNTADINGPLNAENCSFNLIAISTKEMNLSSCKANKIIVRISNSKKEQIINLDATTISGSIVFEQGNGKVIAQNGSVIEGKIFGGVLVQE